jgi:hypothetical protein
MNNLNSLNNLTRQELTQVNGGGKIDWVKVKAKFFNAVNSFVDFMSKV